MGAWRAGIVALVLLGLSPHFARCQTLYGITWGPLAPGIPGNNPFLSIDAATGAGTPVLPGNQFLWWPDGLGFRGKKLYTFDGDGTNAVASSNGTQKVFQVNPLTGNTGGNTDIGFPGSAPGWVEGGFAFRSDGIGFLNGLNNNFYSVDLTAGTHTLVTGAFTPGMIAFAFDPTDVLYGIAHAAPNITLYTINSGTGAATALGTVTGLPAFAGMPFGGLSFDPTSGKLFAALCAKNTNSDLYTIDTTTLAATKIGSIGSQNVVGIAFPPVGVTVNPTSVNVVEGGATATYTVVLNWPPSGNVTVTATPDAQETVAPTTLTFTPANWNVAQTVTVTAVNHGVYVPPHTGVITHTAASADPAYNTIPVASVTVNITSSFPPPSGTPSPPAGVPGGTGVGEGSYAGCADPPAPGGEANYGFGAGVSGQALPGVPVLAGPFLDGGRSAPADLAAAPPAGSSLQVFNVSGRGSGQDVGGRAGPGAAALGWAVMAALALAGAAALATKLRGTAAGTWDR